MILDRTYDAIAAADLAIAAGHWPAAAGWIAEAKRIAALRLPPGHPLALRVALAAAELAERSQVGANQRAEFERIAHALIDAPPLLGIAAATAEQRAAEGALRTGELDAARSALQRADLRLSRLQGADGVGRLQVAYLRALSDQDLPAAERVLQRLAKQMGPEHPDLQRLSALAP